MATITKRGGYQWQAKVRRRGYPSVSKTFETQTAAKQWVRMIESEMDRGSYVSRGASESTTLKEAMERYLVEITPSKKGAKQESNRIKVWMRHPLATAFLASIRSSDVARYRDERLEEGISPITVNNELIILSHLFNVARKEWGMESLLNPVANIRKPKLPPGRSRRLEKDEEDRLISEADFPMKQLIILALETGMRMGEILSVEWSWIDLNRRLIALCDTKNGESRNVPLSRAALHAVISMPCEGEERVFPGITSSATSHRFRNLCKRVGIEGLRFHDLRHEATSRLFEKNLGLMEVATITGHKTPQMLKRYTHLRAEDLARKLG